MEKRRKGANDQEQLKVRGECARSRRREKEREAKGSRSLAKERERESGTRNAGIDSRRRRRQPADSLKHTTNRAKSTRFRDKKKPNSRVSKRAEKREREGEREREETKKLCNINRFEFTNCVGTASNVF